MKKQTKKTKIIKQKTGFLSSKPRVIAIVLGFAAIGSFLVYRSFAAVLPASMRGSMLGFKRMNIANGGIVGVKNTSIVTDPLTKAQVYKVPGGSYVTTNGAKEMPSSGIFCFSIRADQPIARARGSRFLTNGVVVASVPMQKVKTVDPGGEKTIGQLDLELSQIYSQATQEITTKWTSLCTKMVNSNMLAKPGNIKVVAGIARNYSKTTIYIRQAIQDVPTY